MTSYQSSPLVTVVIPSYNHQEFIAGAIESVLSSTLTDLELVIIDDGSVDTSVEVIRQFHDSRIRLLCQENRGAHNAINRGAKEARAPWLAILNSDDMYHPEKLERHFSLHRENSSAEASLSRARFIDEHDRPLPPDHNVVQGYERAKNREAEHESLFESLLRANSLLTTSALFINRMVFLELGGLLPLRFTHDWFLYLSLASRGRLHIIEEALVDYRRHGANTITENRARLAVEASFVTEWFLAKALETQTNNRDIKNIFSIIDWNRHLSEDILACFYLWRMSCDNDRHKACSAFETEGHPVIERALALFKERHERSPIEKLRRWAGKGALSLPNSIRKLLGYK